ncbi:MAG: CPBP family intramembrane metalloprotease [Clostridiales bacterium]|nr:CPBP family intramembrane metalloprotease [Clostridiales bacterium]
MKIGKIAFMILNLVLLQLGRIIFKYVIFIFIDRSLLSDVIVNMLYMGIIIGVFIAIIKKKKMNINIFPEKFNIKYKVFTIIVSLFFIITPIVTTNYQLYNILSLIYNAIITVIFEEFIFRGYIFKEISLMKNDLITYIVSTLLFGIWHFGYIDTIIWRTSLFYTNSDIVNIMFWKVLESYNRHSNWNSFRIFQI